MARVVRLILLHSMHLDHASVTVVNYEKNLPGYSEGSWAEFYYLVCDHASVTVVNCDVMENSNGSYTVQLNY